MELILLVIGHGVLAIEANGHFSQDLVYYILGVGCLKPNISTMVGGLYKKGDIRRDQGFTIFYIGINIGAFLRRLIVGAVGARSWVALWFRISRDINGFWFKFNFVVGQKHLDSCRKLLR